MRRILASSVLWLNGIPKVSHKFELILHLYYYLLNLLTIMQHTIGFSPCPNDTFIFDALINKRIDSGNLQWQPVIEDVEQLNLKAFHGSLDVTKLSFGAFARASEYYQILHSGAALGKNCGPLLVVKKDFRWSDLPEMKVAIPGYNTTANLLLSIFAPEIASKSEVLFSNIEDAVLSGDYDAGLIIHESRFTYEAKGLKKLADMGELWEQYTGSPIPLGCIAVKRSLPEEVKFTIGNLVRSSVEYAFAHPGAAQSYIHQYASEMNEEVQQRHINLYVNEFSIDLGLQGVHAIELLFRKGKELNLMPDLHLPIFVERKTIDRN